MFWFWRLLLFQFGTSPGTWGSGKQADRRDPDWAENDICSIFSQPFITDGKVSDSDICPHDKFFYYMLLLIFKARHLIKHNYMELS